MNTETLQTMAGELWHNLAQAMVSDGFMGFMQASMTTGPQTTAVIVKTVEQMQVSPRDAAWLGMHIKPKGGRQVIACDKNNRLHILVFDADQITWRDRDGRGVATSEFIGWCFVTLP